jgi:uncharacterized membrane protein YkoI
MKRRSPLVLVIALTTVFVATSGFAAPSEAELMAQAKISTAQAEKIALAKVPRGKIQSVELENEHHALVWSFDIATPGSKNITEVLVNAKTGNIISISAETLADQAKENEADKATSNR